MAYTQKYALVSFIRPIAIGAEFGMVDWPLHITLADVFAVDRMGTNIESKLNALAAESRPISVRAHREAALGTAQVVLLDKNKDLLELHRRLVDLLEANGAKFNSPEFTRDGFLPHCTIQKTGRLHDGDRAVTTMLALVDMFPGNDWQRRKVIRLFALSGE